MPLYYVRERRWRHHHVQYIKWILVTLEFCDGLALSPLRHMHSNVFLSFVIIVIWPIDLVHFLLPIKAEEPHDHFFLPCLHLLGTFLLFIYAAKVHYSMLFLVKILDHMKHLGDYVDRLLDTHSNEFMHMVPKVFFQLVEILHV